MPQTLDTAADSSNTGLDKETCRICRRQVSRYTCPSCNIPYCSLSCFRADAHAHCAETFYKREVESEIRSKPSATLEERKRMLELLRKFEQEDGATSLEDLEENEDGDDLASRLADIDIDSISASDLWEKLTPEERNTFMKSIEDPSNAQSLLHSGILENSIVLPWWEAPQITSTPADVEEGTQDVAQMSAMRQYGKKPSLIPIPDRLLRRPPSPDTGPPLLYNICAVLVAYAFITRYLAVSPISSVYLSKSQDDDATVARNLIKTLTPFLVEHRSRTLLTSMDDITTDFWGKLVETGKSSRDSFPLLLRDAAYLLSPKRVTELSSPLQQTIIPPSHYSDLSFHPHISAFLALSDILYFFQAYSAAKASKTSSIASAESQKETPTTHKLRFYAAYVAMVPSPILASFAAEVTARASRIEEEIEGSKLDANTRSTDARKAHQGKQKVSEAGQHLIEEL